MSTPEDLIKKEAEYSSMSGVEHSNPIQQGAAAGYNNQGIGSFEFGSDAGSYDAYKENEATNKVETMGPPQNDGTSQTPSGSNNGAAQPAGTRTTETDGTSQAPSDSNNGAAPPAGTGAARTDGTSQTPSDSNPAPSGVENNGVIPSTESSGDLQNRIDGPGRRRGLKVNDHPAAIDKAVPVVSIKLLNKNGRPAYINRYGVVESPRLLIQHEYRQGTSEDPACELDPDTAISKGGNDVILMHNLKYRHILEILDVAWCYTDPEVLLPGARRLEYQCVYVHVTWWKDDDTNGQDWVSRHRLCSLYNDPQAKLQHDVDKSGNKEGVNRHVLYEHVDQLIATRARDQEEAYRLWHKSLTGSSPDPVVRSSITPEYEAQPMHYDVHGLARSSTSPGLSVPPDQNVPYSLHSTGKPPGPYDQQMVLRNNTPRGMTPLQQLAELQKIAKPKNNKEEVDDMPTFEDLMATFGKKISFALDKERK